MNISASPFSLKKAEFRRQMIRQEALKHGRYFFYLNQVGGNDELVFDGHSIGVDPEGREAVRARDFDEDLLIYDVPLPHEAPRPAPPAILRDVSRSDEEAVHGALVLGMRDYAHKCGFRDAVLGLSGGIDSALTACVAAAALGPEHVFSVAMPRATLRCRVSRMRASSPPASASTIASCDRRHPFRHTSTRCRRRSPAGRPCDGREPSGAHPRSNIDGALQQVGYLLSSTGNKSELAVGYCTGYGDMGGGLAVISDVPKTLVYRIARFINRQRIIIPESTLTKAPTAELRPNQKDSDILPPYEILDQIVEAYVERGLDVDAICDLGLDPAIVVDVLRRIDLAEYKRRQAAPGIRISSKAFGVGRRYPVAADYRALTVARAHS